MKMIFPAKLLMLALLEFTGVLWCILTIALYMRFTGTKSSKSSPKIPGLKLPCYSVYGHLVTLLSNSVMKKMSLSINAAVLQCLVSHAAIFQKEPLFQFVAAFTHGIILTKPESVEELLSSNVVLQKSEFYQFLQPFLGTGLLTSDGSKWKSRRKLLTYSFHFDILKQFIPIFDEQAKILVSILKKSAHEDWIDIRQPITFCSLDIICETTLGVHIGAQTDSQSEYAVAAMRATRAAVERATNPLLYPGILFRWSKLGRQFKKDVECLHSFTRKVIREKKEAFNRKGNHLQNGENQHFSDQSKGKRKALMDLLLDIHMNHEDFTIEDMREELDTFAFEGHDTTAVGICWALYLIGLYPDVQSKVHQELDEMYGDDQERPATEDDLREMQFLERVVKESQRLYPSVPFFGRNVEEDINISGYKVKKGSSIGVVTYSYHRNPDVFPNPEKFDPDRFLPENCVGRHPFAYVPFSAGPRNCIDFVNISLGSAFAYPNDKILTSTIAFQKIVFLTKHEAIEEFVECRVPVAKPLQNVLIAWFGNGLFSSFGPKWKSRRKLLNPLFYKNVLKEFVSTFDEESKVLVDVLKSRSHETWIDIVDPLAFCSMDIVGETILGVQLKTQKGENSKFIEAMTRSSQALAERFINPVFYFDMLFRISTVGRQFKRDINYLHTFAGEVIRKRKSDVVLTENGHEECSDSRKSRKKDLLDYLLDVHMSNSDFPEEDIKGELVLLMFAGQDTTASSMSWALYLIGLHPEIQSKIQDELDDIFKDDHDRSVTADDLKEMRYLECVLQESQRLYPSVPFNGKQCLEDFQLSGHRIKKGSIILFSPYQLHRNPEVFPDPEKFDPDRFLPENSVGRSPFAYIPFSFGDRTCIGRHYAMMEQKTVFANVLRNFSVRSMEHRDKIVPSADLILRSACPLKLKFTPRNS